MSLETFVSICCALHAASDELLWGVAHPADSLLAMWEQPEQKKQTQAGHLQKKTGSTQTEAGRPQADSYSLYVRIMKSVAEIMNES